MRPTPPTLEELRRRELQSSDARIGNWLARRFARPTAIYGTWLAVRLGASANQLTIAALAASLISALAIATGTRIGFVCGSLVGLLAFWLDRVDGQVARWRGTAGLSGVYLDYLMHHAATLALGFALGYGLAVQSGGLHWAASGFSIAVGWTFLSIQNDCRYKAFFQPLKRSVGLHRVQGGGGGRPVPADPWPTRGRAMFTWPAYKMCEPHAVLMTLLGLSVLAALSPLTWQSGWRVYVVIMAVMAPVLATARIARAVRRRAVEDEFARWFPQLPVDHGSPKRRRPMADLVRADTMDD